MEQDGLGGVDGPATEATGDLSRSRGVLAVQAMDRLIAKLSKRRTRHLRRQHGCRSGQGETMLVRKRRSGAEGGNATQQNTPIVPQRYADLFRIVCRPDMSLVVPEAHVQFQHILRLLNTNVDGKRKIMYALTEIKGVGRRYANIVCKKADVDLAKR